MIFKKKVNVNAMIKRGIRKEKIYCVDLKYWDKGKKMMMTVTEEYADVIE